MVIFHFGKSFNENKNIGGRKFYNEEWTQINNTFYIHEDTLNVILYVISDVIASCLFPTLLLEKKNISQCEPTTQEVSLDFTGFTLMYQNKFI